MTARKPTPAELAFTSLFSAAPPPPTPETAWDLLAIAYPAVDEARGREADPVALEAPLRQNQEWLDRILTAAARPAEPPTWFAFPTSPIGPEALFAGWQLGERRVQVAGRRYELHVRTEVGPRDQPGDAALAERAIAIAGELLACPRDSIESYGIRRAGAFVIGESLRSAQSGWKKLGFATDGVGVKYSVMKFHDTTDFKGPPTPTIEQGSWFAPPEISKKRKLARKV